jgi:hypothetical protein
MVETKLKVADVPTSKLGNSTLSVSYFFYNTQKNSFLFLSFTTNRRETKFGNAISFATTVLQSARC